MGDTIGPYIGPVRGHVQEATRRAVDILARYRHWSLVTVGVLFTFVSELVLFLMGTKHTVIHFLELLLPIAVGVGLIWYGFELERGDYSSRHIGVIALAVLGGMGIFVVLATYMRFLVSLEATFPEPDYYLLLNAMAIGAVINFIYALQYVRIQRSRRQLESRTNRLVKIASMVSHDLRNPLNVALGRVELIDETYDDIEGIGSIQRALRRIESLTEELLVIARGNQTVAATESESLEESARTAWQVVDSPDVDLDVTTTLPVAASPNKLHHLLENLFRNAIDHGDTTSTIEVGEIESGEGFYVADDGEGIDPAQRERILSHGFTTADDGNGLGLYIVEEIADAHGWEIRVKESADGGARFEFVVEKFGTVNCPPSSNGSS